MNKIYFFVLAVFCLFATNADAQATKQAFVEEFTQASCPPCASQNPAFDMLLDNNEEGVVVLKYQTSFPGVDPMNADNPTEVEARWNYYGVFTGVPSGAVDGTGIANDCNAYDAAPACLAQDDIDAANAVGSAFEIAMTGGIVDGILTVAGTITAVIDAEATTPVFRVAMTERTITSEDAPGGTNGETEFNHVMKKFLTGTAGDALPTTWAAGDVFDFEYTLDIATVNIYQVAQVRVVGFIQDDADKYVHQAATVNPDITVSFTNNAGVVDVAELLAVCPGEATVSPIITITNGGNNNLTSADIVYSVNGGAEQTFAYSGDISTLGQEEVTLDPISFTATAVNTVDVTISNPNGETDEDASGDSASREVLLAPVSDVVLTVTVTMDCWGEETSWEFVDDSGAVAASSPSYGTAPGDGEVFTDEVTLEYGKCYSFNYTDSYGDGLHGGQYSDCGIDGSIVITDASGVVVYDYDGSYNITTEASAFATDEASAVQELTSLNALSLFPNPVSTELNVNFSLEETTELNVTVLNAIGQVVERNANSFAAGANYININTSDFANGMYFLQIEGNEGVKTAKFTVSK